MGRDTSSICSIGRTIGCLRLPSRKRSRSQNQGCTRSHPRSCRSHVWKQQDSSQGPRPRARSKCSSRRTRGHRPGLGHRPKGWWRSGYVAGSGSKNGLGTRKPTLKGTTLPSFFVRPRQGVIPAQGQLGRRRLQLENAPWARLIRVLVQHPLVHRHA